MQIIFTASQQTSSERQVQGVEQEQLRVTSHQAALAASRALRNAKYRELRVLLVELGHAPPDTITEVHRELDADGAWTSRDLYINEALP